MSKKQKRSSIDIVNIVTAGIKGEFWSILCNAVDESIEILKEKRDEDESLKNLPADQYKFEAEVLKKEIQCLEYLKNLPKKLIAFHQEENTPEEEFDPYEK